MALPAVLLTELGVALRAAGPAMLSKIAARIGSNATAASILAGIKNNKITAALVGLEVFGPASDFITRLIGSDEAMGSIVEQLTSLEYKPDSAKDLTDDGLDLTKFADEFELISDFGGILGGHDNVLKLRNMLKIDDSVFKLYQQVRALGNR